MPRLENTKAWRGIKALLVAYMDANVDNSAGITAKRIKAFGEHSTPGNLERFEAFTRLTNFNRAGVYQLYDLDLSTVHEWAQTHVPGYEKVLLADLDVHLEQKDLL